MWSETATGGHFRLHIFFTKHVAYNVSFRQEGINYRTAYMYSTESHYIMLPESSTNLIIATFRQWSLSTNVDCQKQKTCCWLHFLDFAIANLFVILVLSISHTRSCSMLGYLESGCSASSVQWYSFVHYTSLTPLLRRWMTHICVICSNAQGAERRIHASSNWICQVRRIDVYKRQRDNFSRTCLFATKFSTNVLISRHANPENFIQIDQKLFELWSLVANHLTEPRLQDFQEVKPRPRVGNLYYSKSHLDTFPTVKKTMGATKPFWHLKWNNRFSTTDFLHWPSWLCL